MQKVDAVLLPAFWNTDIIALSNTSLAQDYSILFDLFTRTGVGNVPGDYTVFAPNNAAFEALGNETLDALLNDITMITAVLVNHVVKGVYPSADLIGTELTAFGNLTLNFSGTTDYPTVNGANFIIKDQLANNGIVNAIDKVLLATSETAPPASSPNAAPIGPISPPVDMPNSSPVSAPGSTPASPPVKAPTQSSTSAASSVSWFAAACTAVLAAIVAMT